MNTNWSELSSFQIESLVKVDGKFTNEPRIQLSDSALEGLKAWLEKKNLHPTGEVQSRCCNGCHAG